MQPKKLISSQDKVAVWLKSLPTPAFLDRYQNDQIGLYNEFSSRIKEAIQQIEINYPVGQNLKLRYELYRLNEFFTWIEPKLEQVEKPFEQLVHQVYKLYDVIGFNYYVEFIAPVILDMHVGHPEDLNLYECSIKPENYLEKEKADLQYACSEARQLKNKYLNHLIDKIEYIVKTEVQPDAKLYLRVLMHAHYAVTGDDELKQKINNPNINNQQDALSHCLTLANSITGKASTANRVTGALFAFVGTSLVITAIVAAPSLQLFMVGYFGGTVLGLVGRGLASEGNKLNVSTPLRKLVSQIGSTKGRGNRLFVIKPPQEGLSQSLPSEAKEIESARTLVMQ